jgi:hypothetical protein
MACGPGTPCNSLSKLTFFCGLVSFVFPPLWIVTAILVVLVLFVWWDETQKEKAGK